MQRKLASYVLLSFLSFSVATTLFHTVANAQTIERIPVSKQVPSPTIILPTPTTAPIKFTLKSVTIPTPTVTQAKEKNPTTTVKQPQQTKTVATAAVVATVEPTTVPTSIPTASPAPKSAVAAPADLDPFFDKYASEYSIDKEDLKRIAKCEAGFNSQSDTGLYAGMYQFHAQTWASTRNAMGLDSNPDLRKNAEESIRTAAFKIKNGGRGAWPNC